MNPAGSILPAGALPAGVLLDTSIIIAHFRNDPGVTAHLIASSALYVPWIVLGELRYGALRAQRREAHLALIREFLQIAIPLFPDLGTSEGYGDLKAELAAVGRPIPDNDLWIASLARQYALPLATRDAHFSWVANLTTLVW
ncbi:MAG: PIN domain-containing protein [Bryobacterales bacterium]|nr:PIN domain-containing protein [Bryobacterales bacterium]MBV9398069.1 PIN domain-containing protein [Bryobacterales bacterium]